MKCPIFAGYSGISLLAITAAFVVADTSARAQTIAIPNSSFETPAHSSDTVGLTFTGTAAESAVEDWTESGTSYQQFGTINYASDTAYTGGIGLQGIGLGTYYTGGYYSYLTTGNATNYDSATGQSGYVDTVSAGATYTLTVDVATKFSNGGTFSLSLVDSAGTVFATRTFNNSSLSTTLAPFVLTYTSSASPTDLGDGFQIRLGEGGNGAGNVYDAFDDVQLTDTSAPEPRTYAMLFAGLGLLFLFGPRKKTA